MCCENLFSDDKKKSLKLKVKWNTVIKINTLVACRQRIMREYLVLIHMLICDVWNIHKHICDVPHTLLKALLILRINLSIIYFFYVFVLLVALLTVNSFQNNLIRSSEMRVFVCIFVSFGWKGKLFIIFVHLEVYFIANMLHAIVVVELVEKTKIKEVIICNKRVCVLNLINSNLSMGLKIHEHWLVAQ